MKRRHDWPERLHAALEAMADQPSIYGANDCFTLAMDVHEALTGVDPWASERGRYTTPKGAAKRLKANGFDDLPAFVASLGSPVAVSFAGRGDIGITRNSDGVPAIVVCDGASWLGRSDTVGLIAVPRSSVEQAHRIG